MTTNKKKSFLKGIPSWASALFIFLVELILILALHDMMGESATGEALIWTTVGIVNAICCFFIVKQNPKSIWYVLLLINALFIIIAFVMAVFGEDTDLRDLLFLCGIVVLSIIASIIGARIGRRKAISGDNNTN
jgi:CDP-diglyceride synthetase